MNLTPLQIEDVELMLLRKYQKAHMDGNTEGLRRISIALEEVRSLIEEEKRRRR